MVGKGQLDSFYILRLYRYTYLYLCINVTKAINTRTYIVISWGTAAFIHKGNFRHF